MDRMDVTSSVIDAVGHSRVLEVRFENGRVVFAVRLPLAP